MGIHRSSSPGVNAAGPAMKLLTQMYCVATGFVMVVRKGNARIWFFNGTNQEKHAWPEMGRRNC